MAASGCLDDKRCNGEGEKFVCSTGFEVLAIKTSNGVGKGYSYGDKTAVCMRVEIEKLANCLNGFKSPIDNRGERRESFSSPEMEHQQNSLHNGRKRRRSLRFDSSESSDSGVAALSATDSSQSSGTSDFTEPCSPPSPDTPRSCTPLQTGPCCPCGHGFTSLANAERTYSGLPCCCATAKLHTPTNFATTRLVDPLPVICPAEEKVVDKAAVDESNESVVKSNEPKEFPKTLLRVQEVRPSESKANQLEARSKISVGKKSKDATSKSTFSNSTEIQCQWDKCSARLKSTSEVVEHLQGVHVSSQVDAESFVCLWSTCKVYKKSSSSLSWLERHVVSHAGNKPFQCIVDGCGHRFTTQAGLERHVNGHFNQQTCANAASNGAGGHAIGGGGLATANTSSSRRKDDTPTKFLKKKKLRYRRRSCAVKTEDFFDAGIMESVQQNLVALSDHTQVDISGCNNSVTFHSSIRARRIESSGKIRVLIHWHPENMIPDQWILESQVEERLKWTIPFSALASKDVLLNPIGSCRRVRKNCRK